MSGSSCAKCNAAESTTSRRSRELAERSGEARRKNRKPQRCVFMYMRMYMDMLTSKQQEQRQHRDQQNVQQHPTLDKITNLQYSPLVVLGLEVRILPNGW